jgi:hypothetical protein
MTDAQTVSQYLNGLPRTTAAPVLVKIGRTEYVGAIYSQERDTLEGSRAFEAGERTYVQHGIYLLGDLPASYRRSTRTAYDLDGNRYYVAGYFPQDEPNDFHPFGRMFQLFPDEHGVTTNPETDEPYPAVPANIVHW